MTRLETVESAESSRWIPAMPLTLGTRRIDPGSGFELLKLTGFRRLEASDRLINWSCPS